jgi:hypothetical protein
MPPKYRRKTNITTCKKISKLPRPVVATTVDENNTRSVVKTMVDKQNTRPVVATTVDKQNTRPVVATTVAKNNTKSALMPKKKEKWKIPGKNGVKTMKSSSLAVAK